MLCIGCLSNSATSSVLFCPKCLKIRAFRKQVVPDNILDEFAALEIHLQWKIIRLVHSRIGIMIKYRLLSELNVSDLIRDYTFMSGENKLKAELEDTGDNDRTIFERIDYHQYKSPSPNQM